jgi:hypothetical protein
MTLGCLQRKIKFVVVFFYIKERMHGAPALNFQSKGINLKKIYWYSLALHNRISLP